MAARTLCGFQPVRRVSSAIVAPLRRLIISLMLVIFVFSIVVTLKRLAARVAHVRSLGQRRQ